MEDYQGFVVDSFCRILDGNFGLSRLVGGVEDLVVGGVGLSREGLGDESSERQDGLEWRHFVLLGDALKVVKLA